jgi:hypothetical protein
MTTATVEARLRVLEDIEEIRKLKARYCDDSHNPDTLGPLFAEDAVWEASRVGRAEGREAIKTLLGDIGRSGTIRNPVTTRSIRTSRSTARPPRATGV